MQVQTYKEETERRQCRSGEREINYLERHQLGLSCAKSIYFSSDWNIFKMISAVLKGEECCGEVTSKNTSFLQYPCFIKIGFHFQGGRLEHRTNSIIIHPPPFLSHPSPSKESVPPLISITPQTN